MERVGASVVQDRTGSGSPTDDKEPNSTRSNGFAGIACVGVVPCPCGVEGGGALLDRYRASITRCRRNTDGLRGGSPLHSPAGVEKYVMKRVRNATPASSFQRAGTIPTHIACEGPISGWPSGASIGGTGGSASWAARTPCGPQCADRGAVGLIGIWFAEARMDGVNARDE